MQITPMPQPGFTARPDTQTTRQSNIIEKALSVPVLVEPQTAIEGQPGSPAKDDSLARLSELAKREKRILAEARRIKAEKEALETQKLEYEKSYFPKKRLAEDPFGALSEAGVTYDQLTQAALNQPTPTDLEVRKLKAQIEEMRAAQEQTKSMMADGEKRSYEQTINQIRADTKQLINSNASYEAIKTFGAEDEVVKRVEEAFQKGTLPDLSEVCESVEKDLIEAGMKMMSLGKIKEKLVPIAPAPTSRESQPFVRTLTNSASVSSSRAPSSDKARRERAMKAFLGQPI